MTRKKESGKKKKDQEPKKPKVHKDLEGFEIKVNPLGEITSNYNIEQLNEFLNKNVRDKKLVHRKDLGFEPVGATDTPDPDDDDLIDDSEAYNIDEDDMDLDLDDDKDAMDDADELDLDDDEMGEDPNFDEFDEEDK